MKENIQISPESHIFLNNADEILKKLNSQKSDYEENFFTMVQGNSFCGVDISESSIHDNSHFIVGLWD